MNSETLLLQAFAEAEPRHLARLCERSPAEAARILADLSIPNAARVASQMNVSPAADFLSILDSRRAAAVLEAMPARAAASLLARLPQERASELLLNLPDRLARLIRGAGNYSPGTAGGVMDLAPPVVREDTTVADVLIERPELRKATGGLVFVVDEAGRLRGITHAGLLIDADPQSPIGRHKIPAPGPLLLGASLTGIVTHPEWKNHRLLPVTDAEGHLLGAIDFATMRKLEGELGSIQRPTNIGETAHDLAELYTVGLVALVRAVVPGLRAGTAKEEAR